MEENVQENAIGEKNDLPVEVEIVLMGT